MKLSQRGPPFRVNSNVRLTVEGIQFRNVFFSPDPLDLNMLWQANTGTFREWAEYLMFLRLLCRVVVNVFDSLESVVSDDIEQLMSCANGLCLKLFTLVSKIINEIPEHWSETPHQVLYSI